MSRGQELRQQVAVWGLILLLWCLMVLVFAGQLVLTGSLEWTRAISLSLRDWWPWALLTPPVAWLASAFRLERGHWGVSVPVHLGACAAAVMISQLLVSPPESTPPEGPMGEGLQRRNRFGRGAMMRDTDAAAPWSPAPPHTPSPGTERRPLHADPPPPPAPQRPMELRHFFVENLLGRRAQFNVPIYWIIVSLVHALGYYRRSQEREQRARELESSLTKARLDALRAQLQPHFLFNTLNAISTLVHKDAHAADEMIANLSALLRAALNAEDQEIPLRRELDMLKPYLEIQQARFGDRLDFAQTVDEPARDVMVPVLILQPLVENAVRHGIEPQPGTGRVTISAGVINGQLRLEVRDNGRGIDSATALSGRGIGLANTRARLEALYGGKADMSVEKHPEGGTLVRISLPARQEMNAGAPEN